MGNSMPANVETMAYAGQTPWHGMGNAIKKGAPVEDVLVDAGLAWPVEIAHVEYSFDGRRHTDRSHQVMFRGDTGEVFDVVGPDYTPFQNDQVLDFFREYVEAGEMWIETAGSLNNGRDIWALAKMDESFNLAGKDKVEGYVFLMNPHRYGKGAVAKFTSVRVVCWNTFQMALRGGGDSIRLWHNREFNAEMREEAKQKLGIARDQMEAFKKNAVKLTRIELTPQQVIDVAAKVMRGSPGKPREEQNRRTERVIELYEGAGLGAKLGSAEGTAWGLLNAVTQYIDHEYGRTQNNRLTYSWIHGGAGVKQRAMEELLEIGK
jgi:phage/plasmid-like protein (TIGR03299 family)